MVIDITQVQANQAFLKQSCNIIYVADVDVETCLTS